MADPGMLGPQLQDELHGELKSGPNIRPLTLSLHEYGADQRVALTPAEHEILNSRFANYLALSRDWDTGAFKLNATHYVGAIQIGGLRIRIQPKCPAANFFYMLTRAYGVKIDWNDETLLSQSDDILELVVEAFVKQVEGIARRGIYRAYRSEEDRRPYLRGRLLIAQQLRHETAAPNSFAQHLHEYTSDVAENRILAWTLHRLVRMTWGGGRLNQRIRRLEQVFAEVALVPVYDSDFDMLAYTRLNEGYRGPHRLARLLLQMRSIEGVEGQDHFSGWLLDMERLFQQFVGAELQESFTRESASGEYIVKLQGTLYLDETRSKTASPDVLVYQHQQPVAVVDTKHKILDEDPKDVDRRQMLEYANNLHLTHGYLVYSGGKASQPSRNYTGGWPMKLHTIVWKLDGSLKQLQMECRHNVESLLRDIESQAKQAQPHDRVKSV